MKTTTFSPFLIRGVQLAMVAAFLICSSTMSRPVEQNYGRLQEQDSEITDQTASDDGICATIDCIRNAMANPDPGDEIIIKSGTYKVDDKIKGAFNRKVYLHSSKNGTSAEPIILRGERKANPPVIEGLGYTDGYLLSLEGDFWIIRDIEFKTGSKGVVLDHSNHNKLINITVHDIGEEGIHLRDGSSSNLVDGCKVYDTGKKKPGFGEGFYVGSDKGQHNTYERSCDNNTFQNCSIGPNVAAEGADIKEGTENTVIKNCTFTARGMSGGNSADAFIDLKGSYGFVYNNTFNLDGSPIINAGVDFLDRGTGFKTGFRNAIFNNTFNLGSRALEIPTARKKQGSPKQIHVWDNQRNPDSSDFPISDGTVNFVTQSCPTWNIVSCDGGGGNNNRPPTVSITAPNENPIVSEGYSLQVDANASDSDGSIANLRLFIDDNLVRQENFAPYNWGHAGSPDPGELSGLAPGSYTLKVVATDEDGATGQDILILTVNGDDGGGGNSDCTFGTPSTSGLKSIDASYRNVYVLGNNGPALDNFKEFTINWDARYDGLYQFAFNTDNGVPKWYVDFSDSASFQFKNPNPEISLSNTGISGMDGSYWVNTDGDNLVMVSKAGSFSIYFSTSSAAPDCNNTSGSALKALIPSVPAHLSIYPNPANDKLNFSGLANEATDVEIWDMQGRPVLTKALEKGEESLDVGGLRPGLHIAIIRGDGFSRTIKFYKRDQ